MKVPKARKLPSGNWFINLRLGGQNIPVTRRTEKECIRAAQMIKAEHIAGKKIVCPEEAMPPQKLPTLGEMIDGYVATNSNILSPTTIRGYGTIRRNRFQELMDMSVSDISDADWKRVVNQEAQLCSPKYLHNSWGLICTVLRSNKLAIPDVKTPQIPPNERDFLTPDEILTLVKSVAGEKEEVVVFLGLHSLRRSEICGLRWENVDLEAQQLYIRGSRVVGPGSKVVTKKETKNRSSTRVVPFLIPEMYNALQAIPNKEGLVVPLYPNTVGKWVNQACAAAGVPQVGTHGLRHSFVSLAYHLKLSELTTMKIGGWSDYQTMRRIYTHISQKQINDEVGLVQGFFKNVNENVNGI